MIGDIRNEPNIFSVKMKDNRMPNQTERPTKGFGGKSLAAFDKRQKRSSTHKSTKGIRKPPRVANDPWFSR